MLPANDWVVRATVPVGVGVLMADGAKRRGLAVPDMPEAAQLWTLEFVPFAAARNLFDATGQFLNDPSLLDHAIELAAKNGGSRGPRELSGLGRADPRPERSARCLLDRAKARNPRLALRSFWAPARRTTRVTSSRWDPRVGGCRKARISGEHKMWELTSRNVVFSESGPVMAGTPFPAMSALVSGGWVGLPEGPERSGGVAKRLDATQPSDAQTNILWFPSPLFATYARIYAAINLPVYEETTRVIAALAGFAR